MLKTKDFPKICKNRKKRFQNLCQKEYFRKMVLKTLEFRKIFLENVRKMLLNTTFSKNNAKNSRLFKNVARNRKCSKNVAKNKRFFLMLLKALEFRKIYKKIKKIFKKCC